ncbi:MAG: TonB-dependent receptor [Arenicella sp.]|nr:TonB-dependent receptor [Arenicella sp.]
MVTARKRSETLLDVPISLAVVSAADIQKIGAQDFTDLLRSVPSLTAYQNGPGRTRLSIRGIANGGGNDNDTQNQETVGIYLDEIPISLGAMNPELGLFDMQRVEVLRGPQGTLYGAGSLAGTIRLVSNKPNLSEVEGKAELDVATINKGGESTSLKALVNIPLINDKLAVRISGYQVDGGGYIDNVLTGEEDVNDSDSTGFRISSLWRPNDNLDVEFSYFNHDYSDNGRPEDLDRAPELSRDYPSFDGFDDELEVINLTLNASFNDMKLVSSTSYFDRQVVNRRSLDDLFKTALPPGIIPSELVDSTDFEVFTQEVRLSSDTDAPLQWTVGAYADKKDVLYLNTFPVPGADAILGAPASVFGAPDDNLFFGFDDLTVKTVAVFGEVYYDIGKWTLTAGARYFDWQQDIEFYQSGLFNGGSNSDVRPTGKDSGTNPKFNVAYDLSDDTLIYAQAARGFRYGGINGAIPEAVCADELEQVARAGGDTRFFDADKAWTYEIGSKGTLQDGRVRYNATLFHVDWEDTQTSRSFECGFGFRENVGDVTSNGVEFEVNAQLSDAWAVGLGGSFIDSELGEDVPNLGALEGDSAPFVPEFSFNASVDYERMITDNVTGFVWANLQHVGERNTEFSLSAPNNRTMDSYEVVNLRAGIEWDNYQLELYANNALDDRGVIRALGRPPFDPDAAIRLQPRTIGVTFRTHF